MEEALDFLEELIASDVMGVNISEAKRVVALAEKKIDEKVLRSASQWFEQHGIKTVISNKGSGLAIELQDSGGYLLFLSREEIECRAELWNKQEQNNRLGE